MSLDEIGDLPLDIQSKLLRVIESGEFMRVGESKTQKVSYRCVMEHPIPYRGILSEDYQLPIHIFLPQIPYFFKT